MERKRGAKPRADEQEPDQRRRRAERAGNVDKELEKRGHAFVRYADDCNIYVRSKRAGERVMGLLRRLYARLRLRINESKSAIDFATNRKLLGYSFWMAPGRVVKRRVAKKALITMKERVIDDNYFCRSATTRFAGPSHT